MFQEFSLEILCYKPHIANLLDTLIHVEEECHDIGFIWRFRQKKRKADTKASEKS